MTPRSTSSTALAPRRIDYNSRATPGVQSIKKRKVSATTAVIDPTDIVQIEKEKLNIKKERLQIERERLQIDRERLQTEKNIEYLLTKIVSKQEATADVHP